MRKGDRLAGKRRVPDPHAARRLQIAGELVDQDEGRASVEDLLEGVRAGSGQRLVGFDHVRVHVFAAKLKGEIAPERARGRVLDLGEGRRAGGRADKDDELVYRFLRGELRGHDLLDPVRGELAAGDVVEGDQVVGLPAAEVRLEADHRWCVRLAASDATERFVEKRAQAGRGMGAREERLGVSVDSGS